MLDSKFFDEKIDSRVPAKVLRNKSQIAKKWTIKSLGTVLIPLVFFLISVLMAATKRHNLFYMRSDVNLQQHLLAQLLAIFP